MAKTMEVIKNLIKALPMYIIVPDDDLLVMGHDPVYINHGHNKILRTTPGILVDSDQIVLDADVRDWKTIKVRYGSFYMFCLIYNLFENMSDF